ncbi:MAG: hypothetical protein KC657_24190 [Myxococcales bacterium]|nr:hypothetical protein [Myxococcales bacterium]
MTDGASFAKVRAPLEVSMVSNTQQFDRIRRRKKATNGKANKRVRRKFGTPKFPVHPEGYNASAADAKKA